MLPPGGRSWMLIFPEVKILSLPNPLELCLDYFLGRQNLPECTNKDPTVWLNGDSSPLKYIYKNVMCLMNLKV
jgi:hypothetical protein